MDGESFSEQRAATGRNIVGTGHKLRRALARCTERLASEQDSTRADRLRQKADRLRAALAQFTQWRQSHDHDRS